MLLDKYKFTHNTNTIFWLHSSLQASMQANSNSKNSICLLTFLAMLPFIKRIENKVQLTASPIKVSLKRTEAVAFHIAYKHGFINTNDYLIQEIFTAIDKTI